jgi:uncharacterized membrane protein YfhO
MRPEIVRLRTRSGSDAFLVLSDAFYPGWKVDVDGQPARLVRTNVALRGVAVPSGEHEVVFRFEPASIRLGLVVSLCSLILTACLIVGPPLTRSVMMRRREH